ncbi:hypothetical protein FRC08_010350 [Ceratobasidium sp. 394]|nr:hypothetical protein FRC08_010350 [Ceratobasidium sp. 394]
MTPFFVLVDFQASARSSLRIMERTAGSPSKSEVDVVGSDSGESETGQTDRSAGSRGRGGKGRRGSTRRASKTRESEAGSESGSEPGETSGTKHGATPVTRSRTASKAHEAKSEAENEEPASGSGVKRGAATGSRARGRGSRRGSGRSVTTTSTSVSATPASIRGTRRGKNRTVVQAPVSAVSSISLGAWADDATSAMSTLGPRLSKAAARARQSTSGSSKSGTIGASSSLTELSSPSLGGTQALGSPLLVGARQQESPSLGGTRSDAGMTHVSESVEGTHVSETTGAGGLDEAEAVEVGVEMSPRRKITARVVGHERTDGSLRSPKRADGTFGSPKRPAGILPSSRVKTVVEVVLPSPSKSKHRLSPTRAIATPARLVQASLGGSLSRSPQQVYVLLPTSSAFGRRGRERSSTSDEPSVNEEMVVKGRRKLPGEGDRGSPSKRSRVDHGPSSSRDKGKGKAVAVEPEMEYEMAGGSGRRSRRQSKPTTRALESAQQELTWDGEDLEGESVWVTIQGDQSTGSSAPSEATGSRSMSLSRSTSVGASAGRSTRNNGKRRRDYEEDSGSSKRYKESPAVESAISHPPIVHLQSGDFILRVQDKKCFHYAWDQTIVPRCLACRKKKAGDTCRFSGIRYFKLTPVSFDAIGVSFDSRQVKEQPDYHLPLKWNITPDIAHVDRIRSVISRALYPVLEEELRHALKENAIWRPVEIEVRATCDVCATSMFASCHMCTQCGRELCGECYRQVELMCPAGTPSIYRSAERKDQQLHKYRACAGGNIFHLPTNFRPITRFTRRELEETLQDMKAIIQANETAQPSSRPGSSHITKWASRIPVWNPTSPQASTEPPALSETGSSHDVSSLRGTPDPLLASMPIIASPSMSPTHEDGFGPEVSVEAGKRPVASQHGYVDPAGVPTHPINYFSRDITEETFKPIWARGEAVVVQGLLDDFKIKWTPEYFIQEYGEQDCFIVDCDTNKETWSTVEGFFKLFGLADRGNAILKLKDWPARADFRDDFPELFVDFMKALPIQNYTRRDGILNVASHFATNAIAPDLGESHMS